MLIAITQLSPLAGQTTLNVVLDDAAQKPLPDNISLDSLLRNLKEVIKL